MRLTPTATSIPGRIDWKCDTCSTLTTTGALHIDLREVQAAQRRIKAWENRERDVDARAVDIRELLLMPSVARWRVECSTCVHRCVGCYSIDLRRCQSAFALIRWTAHLHDKRWLPATDWIRFIHRVARESGSPSETTGVW